MPKNDKDKSRIGVIGAGVMGRGIGQLFLQAGHPVHLYDADAAAADQAADFIRGMIERQADKGRIDRADADAMLPRLAVCRELKELAACRVLIEAIVESLEAKQQLFVELENIVPADAVLATNTSSLSVSAIAAACAAPERVAGLHFFNPAPLMRLVEVVPAEQTRPDVVQALTALVNATGHRAVTAADQPGFLVNHAGRGFFTEALRILEEGAAAPVDVDRVARDALGFKMGPFELLDLTGLDVSGKVMQSIYDQFQQEPMFRPSSLAPPRMAAGILGRKTGGGFYRYEDGRKIEPAAPPPPPAGLTRVWLDDAAGAGAPLAKVLAAAGAQATDSPAGDDTICVVQPKGGDTADACARLQLDPARTAAVDPLPPLDRRRTLMLSPVTRAAVRDSAHALLAAGDVPVTVINDSPGFISQRLLATIVNIAAGIVQRRIAAAADLETAVELGLGYPMGPLAWGDKVGPAVIVEILNNMFRLTGDPRYRLSPWLRRRAQCGASLLTEEAERA